MLRDVFRAEPRRPYLEADIDRQVEAVARPGALTAMVNWYRALRYESPAAQRASWRRIDAPVLVLWGDGDRYLGVELAEPSRELVPNVSVEHFPDASHWLQHDEADAVNARLVRFFTEPTG